MGPREGSGRIHGEAEDVRHCAGHVSRQRSHRPGYRERNGGWRPGDVTASWPTWQSFPERVDDASVIHVWWLWVPRHKCAVCSFVGCCASILVDVLDFHSLFPSVFLAWPISHPGDRYAYPSSSCICGPRARAVLAHQSCISWIRLFSLLVETLLIHPPWSHWVGALRGRA